MFNYSYYFFYKHLLPFTHRQFIIIFFFYYAFFNNISSIEVMLEQTFNLIAL